MNPRQPESLTAPTRETHNDLADSHVRYRVLAAACGLAILGYIHRVGFAQALPQIQREFGFSHSAASYIFASFFLAYGLFEIPWGLIGDKLGVRNLLVFLVLGWSFLTGAIVWVNLLPADTVWPLAYVILLRFLFGAFQAGTFPSVSRMMADWMPIAERGTAQGWIWTSSRAGGALAPLIVVWAMQTFNGLAAFWALASLGLIWSMAFWPWFRNRPAEMPTVSHAELERIRSGRTASAGDKHLQLPWRQASRSLSVWSLCAMYGGLGFTGNFFISMLPIYLSNHRGLAAQTVSYLTSIPLACGIVSCLLGGYLSDLMIRRTGNRSLGRRAVPSFGLGLACVALASTVFVTNPVWLGVLLCVTFFGNDLAMGPAWAACADIGEQYAGTLGGLMNMIGSFTAAIGALIAGRLLDHGQGTALFLILAGAYAFGVFAWQGIDVRNRLSHE